MLLPVAAAEQAQQHALGQQAQQPAWMQALLKFYTGACIGGVRHVTPAPIMACLPGSQTRAKATTFRLNPDTDPG
jgi:hypothetical protein